jgi:omega-amidase
MKIAALQFKGSDRIEENFLAIQRGILQAAEQDVRLLVTQECALCGYPPVEVENVSQINFQQLAEATEQIAQLAVKHQMYIGLGTILPESDPRTNSVVLLSPDPERPRSYHKRALWGWDRENFYSGNEQGIYTIDQVKLGFRICFEIRFPEYFRELFRERVEIACVSFCDVSKEPNPVRYEQIKSHLLTRAIENAMFVLSANSISEFQTAPTCLIDADGNILKIAPQDEECLLAFDYEVSPSNFGRDGRKYYSRKLLGIGP